MRDGHERLGALPRAAPGEVDHAVLRGQIIRLRARRRDDIAAEVRQDARVAHALLVRECGRHADERLAAAGHGRAREKVELAARAADLAQAGAFGRDGVL